MRRCSPALVLLVVACRSPSAPPTVAEEEAAALQPKKAPEAPLPDDVFGPWDGVWQGEFRVRAADDAVITTLDVTQRYWSDDAGKQLGRFVEKDRDTGLVTTAEAVNTVQAGGSLLCEVLKSNGEEVRHDGRWTGEAIEWFRKADRLEEHFSERVTTDEQGRTVYVIEGWGEYGGGPRLTFEGRYLRVGDEDQARADVGATR